MILISNLEAHLDYVINPSFRVLKNRRSNDHIMASVACRHERVSNGNVGNFPFDTKAWIALER